MYPPPVPERDLSAERKASLDKMLADTAPLKLIVAGPGTGKTHAFKQLLGGDRKDNLVLTFINLLVKDLTTELGGVAVVETLHKYAVGVLHRQGTPGLSNHFKLYPHLSQMLEAEVEILLGTSEAKAVIEKSMQWLEQGEPIDAFIRAGNYYDAVGFVDVVYRVVQRFIGDPHTITQFRQVLVDEVQDFTKLEVELINQLASQSPVVIAGDDDQAIYGQRHASPDFIRSMAAGDIWKLFELPFCSRCTPVIVEAVRDVVAKAKVEGMLSGRIEKTYECYLPSKKTDGDRYPKLILVECSVERDNAHYAARYIAQQVKAIPSDDIADSYGGMSYPTGLVIGPGNFTKSVADLLEQEGYQVTRPKKGAERIEILDGYRLLVDEESLRLGWRIVCECNRPANFKDILRRTIVDGVDLRDLLDADYVTRHLEMVHLVARLLNGDELTEEESERLASATRRTIDELRDALGLIEHAAPEIDKSKPSVLITTFQGAKGLSGGHVFVVGMNQTFLPKRRGDPTDEDIRLFIVALTRTRKQCHLIYINRYGKEQLAPSRLLNAIDRHRFEKVVVNAAYFHPTPWPPPQPRSQQF
jgi:superfamily I DNA/RNA helicase